MFARTLPNLKTESRTTKYIPCVPISRCDLDLLHEHCPRELRSAFHLILCGGGQENRKALSLSIIWSGIRLPTFMAGSRGGESIEQRPRKSVWNHPLHLSNINIGRVGTKILDFTALYGCASVLLGHVAVPHQLSAISLHFSLLCVFLLHLTLLT